MDIEQLRLILDTLKGAGDGAFILGILWLLRGIMLALILGPMLLYLIIRIARIIADANKYNEEMLHRMRDSNMNGDAIVRRVCESAEAPFYPYIDAAKVSRWLAEAEVALAEKKTRK